MIKSAKYLEVQHFKVKSKLIDSSLKVVHLSDVHIPRSEVSLPVIIQMVQNQFPDVVFITGDLFDCRCSLKDVDTINSFLNQLSSMSKVFWVRGNHELKNRYSKEIINQLVVKPVMNEYLRINDTVEILGVDETARYVRSLNKSDRLTLILCHHPESYSYHLSSNDCYQFSGHVHGGQIRIGHQGLFGPDQGFLLKYSKGFYPMTFDRGLFVCAGLGRSIFPMRINNPLHIIVVDFLPVGYNERSEVNDE